MAEESTRKIAPGYDVKIQYVEQIAENEASDNKSD